ncbi:AcrR family transcriptional regulator [Thermocatellispora tengchongensis]|uniref:AcrR family transcriptional regulator n=1 Tax=Thermocatellispora tengchongensis TaxID=1073253 RepID=A0A840PFS0_9ACTN|nr:TetR/AcrR family transcriptional regulator [Thermocatellispora tengchongensis]MBB5137839.1 AcrR family transcriptional regulator [Thermocatellispora tengchongensis]
MASEHDGGGDPGRTLALLWRGRTAAGRPPGKPVKGRKPRIGVDQIVHAAVAVADAGGLTAVSMARVAEQLGVGPMTLYTHVPGKAELIELMVDAVMTERELPGPGHPARPAGWRAQVEHYAAQTRALHVRHPWLREVSTARPPLGPGMMAEYEYLLSALRDAGLPPSQMFAASGTIVTYVVAAARQEAEDIQIEQATGQTWDAWWGERRHLWDEHFDADAYPTMTQVWLDGGFDDAGDDDTSTEDPYMYGLQRLLDGIEAATRPPRASRP